MAINKLDKTFKSLINKQFTSPDREFYQEKSDDTINIHSREVWMDSVPTSSNEATGSGIAVFYDKFILTSGSVVSNEAYFFMSGSGFVPGSSSYDESFQQSNFISDKYGEEYKVKLYNYSETKEGNSENDGEINEDDPINWIFDYKTGILHIADPNEVNYSIPFKVSLFKFTGSFLNDFSSSISEKINNIETGSSLWTLEGDGNISRNSDVKITGSIHSDYYKTKEDYVLLSGSGVGYIDTNYNITSLVQSGEFAIEVDCQPEPIDAVYNFFGLDDAIHSDSVSVYYHNSPLGALYVYLNINGSGAVAVTQNPVFSSGSPERRKIKICFRENSSDGIKIYADNVEQTLTSAATTPSFAAYNPTSANNIFVNTVNSNGSPGALAISGSFYNYALYSDFSASTKLQEFLLDEGASSTANDNIGSTDGTINGYFWDHNILDLIINITGDREYTQLNHITDYQTLTDSIDNIDQVLEYISKSGSNIIISGNIEMSSSAQVDGVDISGFSSSIATEISELSSSVANEMNILTGSTRPADCLFVSPDFTNLPSPYYSNIGDAITAGSSGDTIIIYPGTYDEDITPKDGVDLVGINQETCIISGHIQTSNTVNCFFDNLTIDEDDENYETVGIWNSASYATFKDCIIKQTSATAINRKTVVCEYDSIVKLENCDIWSNTAGELIQVDYSPSGINKLFLKNSRMESVYSGVDGIILYNNLSIIIQNTVCKLSGSGYFINASSAQNVKIYSAFSTNGLNSNITNIISGGTLVVDADVE